VNNSQRTRLLTLVGLIVLLALALVSAGCAAPAQATPTPTKTPRPEATQLPPATATPIPPTLEPPTATAVPPTAAPATDTPAPVEATAAPDTSAQPAPAATQSADQPISAKIVATLPPRQPGVSIFTGLRPADPAVLNRRPLAIKVDNEPEVVPQTGLSKADVVVESSKEKCMTRYTAIYQSQDASRIGSIRSARLVDKELPVIFDAILSFSGAVEPVRQELLKSDIGDHILEQARFATAFFRDPNIAMPFNVFATTAAQWNFATQKGWNIVPNPTAAWVFSESAPPGGSSASQLAIPIPTFYAQLKPHWTYDPGSGRWLRFIGKIPHIDKADGKQLSAANVIVLGANQVKTLIPEQGTALYQADCNNASVQIQLWGEGPAKIFRDGKVYEGKWVRPDRHAPFRFVDAKGQDIPLKPGNSWWQIVPLDVKVTVAP
jgi:hypothetical protein